jgi:hypothetical protein
VNLLQALDDPNLFQPSFAGPSWAPWRVFLESLFALPLSPHQIELFRRHTGRQTAPVTAFTEASLVVGRRGAKSRMLSLLAVYLAAFRDYTPHLAPGEKVTIGLIAADRAQARIKRFASANTAECFQPNGGRSPRPKHVDHATTAWDRRRHLAARRPPPRPPNGALAAGLRTAARILMAI